MQGPLPITRGTLPVRRHTILLVGLIIFFIGIQLRMVESFTLSDFQAVLGRK